MKKIIVSILVIIIVILATALTGCSKKSAPPIELVLVSNSEPEEDVVTIPMPLTDEIIGYVFLVRGDFVFQGQDEVSMIYRIKKGDTLLGIASRFGPDWDELLENNRYVTDVDKIWYGDQLFIKNMSRFPFDPKDIFIYLTIEKGEEISLDYFSPWYFIRDEGWFSSGSYYRWLYFDEHSNLQGGEVEGILTDKSEDIFHLRDGEPFLGELKPVGLK